MIYPKPSSQALGRNLRHPCSKHSKLHLVSFILRFFGDTDDERRNKIAVVEVKKTKGILYLSLPSGMFYSLHHTYKKEVTPVGRRDLSGQKNHLEDSF